MALEIRTTWAKIGVRTTQPVLEIRQPRGEQQIKRQKVEMVVDREPPRVLIDQSACFKECGIKNMVEMVAETAQLAQRKALEYIGIMAEEGDYLAQIENRGEDPVGELALQSMERESNPEWNIAFIPQSRPKFDVIGHLKIDWRVIQGQIEYRARAPQISFRPGTTKIYLRQPGKIDFRYIDQKI